MRYRSSTFIWPVVLLKPKIIGGNAQGGSAPKNIPAKAAGGPITGPGTGTSDSVLMWGSNGEFMQSAAAVRHYGLDYMKQINSLRAPRYTDGGLIGRASIPAASNAPLAAASGTPINLYLNGQKYPVSAPQDVAKQMQRDFQMEVLSHGDKI